MNELLKLLKEAIGIRPLLPIILILLAGYLFTFVRGYPAKELLYDRWYLFIVLLVITASIATWIFQSGLADRTPIGRYGVYVARFKGDPDRTVHTSLIEAVVANLGAKSSSSELQIGVRDLKRVMEDKDMSTIDDTAAKLNASAIIWGTVIDKEQVYLRLWSPTGGVSRSAKPVSITDISKLAEFSAEIWEAVGRQIEDAQDKKWSKTREREEILALKREVSQLQEIVTSGLVIPGISTRPTPSELKAILVGVADYPSAGMDLRGPPNDVAMLRTALISRNSTWQVSVLLNNAATGKAIRELVQKTASEIDEQGLLLVYLSGHGMLTKDGTAFYLPYDYSINDTDVSGIDLKMLVETTMKTHAQTIFITDSPFDPDKVPSAILKQGAILSAGTRSDQVYESLWRGKYYGSFTAALLETLENAPVDLPITLDGLYGSACLIVKRKLTNMSPRLVAGPDAPQL